MKTTIAITAGICAVLLASCPFGVAAQTNLLMEDFDSYAAGGYPGSPWWNMFSGVGAVVSTEQSHTTPNSLRLESLPNWARWDCVTLTLPQGYVTATAEVYFTDVTRGGAIGFGFVEPGMPNTGWLANAVLFGNDGQIYWQTKTGGSTALGPWTDGHWWYVAISVNYASGLADLQIGIDSQPATLFNDLPADPRVLPASYYGVEVPLNNFGAFGNNFSGTGSSVFFVDSINVEGGDALAVEQTTWGRVKHLYRDK